MDETGKFLLQDLLVAETPTLHGAGLEVLDEYIGILQQAEQHFPRLLLRQVEADRALVAVHADRSEEHTSELQSLMRTSYAVFCLKQKIRSQNLLPPKK